MTISKMYGTAVQNNHLSLHTARKKEGDTNGGNLKKQTGFMRKVSGSIKEKELEK